MDEKLMNWSEAKIFYARYTDRESQSHSRFVMMSHSAIRDDVTRRKRVERKL